MATRLSTQANQTGEETRAKIINATLETLRDEGIVGTTARAIARKGDFNQALIFYHFGGVTGLLVAAACTEGEQRSARYAERLENITSLHELVGVARELHNEEQAEGTLAQLLAGASSSPELREGLMGAFEPWMRLIEDAVERVLSATPYGEAFNSKDLSFAITSLFLGIELMQTLNPESNQTSSLFRTFEQLAIVIEAMLQAVTPATTPTPAPAPAKKAKKKKK
jgi:AcrR family transcriptional regulator